MAVLGDLGRFPLSCILSFLTEVEGTSLLLTRKRYAHQLLPIFRVRKKNQANDEELNVVNNETMEKQKHRHRYAVVPAQDSEVLLARMNTRRIHERSKEEAVKGHVEQPLFPAGSTTVQLAKLECNKDSESGGYRIPTKNPCLRRFLDPVERKSDPWQKTPPTLLVSYPRSGNTLVRTLLERTTGLVTGSDTRPSRNLSRELAEKHGLVGEGITSGRSTPFIKSHWPERDGCASVKAQRVVLIVRNPFDAMDSYWNMNATCTHTKTVTDSVYQRFAEFYHGLVSNEIHIWMKFHMYWLSFMQQEQHSPSVLVVRFEDLIAQPAKELRRILQFCMQTQDLSPAWQARVEQVMGSGSNSTNQNQHMTIDRLGSYKPRALEAEATKNAIHHRGILSIGKSIRKGRFSEELLRYIHDVCGNSNAFPVNYLQLFGYDMFEQNFPNNFHSAVDDSNTDKNNHKSWPALPTPLLNPHNNNDNDSKSTVRINEGNMIRPSKCTYGRRLTLWRHSVTDKDQNPLPVVE